MGYDRIAFFPGNNDTTLISADKTSAQTVYGHTFRRYLGQLGFRTRIVVDAASVDQHHYAINNYEAKIEELPAITRAEIIRHHPVADGLFVETRPPVSSETLRPILAYLATHCDPTDSGLFLDFSSGKCQQIGGF